MAEPLKIRIEAIFESKKAEKSALAYTRLIKDEDKGIKILNESTKKYLADSERGYSKLASLARSTGSVMQTAFMTPLRGLESFSRGVDGLASKFVNLKNVILASSAAYIGSKIFHAGMSEIKAEARARREFGSDSESIIKLSQSLAAKSGRQGEDILAGLTQIGRATSMYEEGAVINGKRLTAQEASRMRMQTTKFGGQLLADLATTTDMGGDELGKLIADAGSGPEGMRRLISAANLPRRVAALNTANEAGKISALLSQSEKEKYAGSLKAGGGRLLPGDFLELAFERARIPREAEATRNTLGFQAGAAKSKAEDLFGDISRKFVEKLTGFFGGGKTLSERFDEAIGWLSSPGGKLATAGAGTLGAAYVGGKLVGKGMGVARWMGGLFGGSKVQSALGAVDSAGAVPVRVVNWGEQSGTVGNLAKQSILNRAAGAVSGGLLSTSLGGILSGGAGSIAAAAGLVTAAGAAGYGVGTLLDRKFGASDWISKTLSGADENQGMRGAYTPEQRMAAMKEILSQVVHVNIGDINAPATTNPQQFVDSILEPIKKALTFQLWKESAGGHAKASAAR